MTLKEEVKAGSIIAAALFLLSAFIILIGGSGFFEKYDRYTVQFMNVAGLETGSQVRLGGVRVGRVLEVQAPKKPGEPVTAVIGIQKATTLYQGTKAIISQTGFVGDIYLLLSIQNTTEETIAPGSLIPSQERVQFDVLMSRVETLSQSVDVLIKDINELFSRKNVKGIETLIGNTNQAIMTGSSNLDNVTMSLKTTADKLSAVLAETEGLIAENKGEISKVIQKAREDLQKAGEMIAHIEATALTVEKTAGTAGTAIEQMSESMDLLIGSMTTTTEEMRALIQELNNKPWSIMYKERNDQ